ncbi:Ubiquitin carboxyl-terminal hydrolase 36 [Frankliniella fusca]|uniref:Ubiquitin carboxyl-terminal hydrolase n=1 Tax=Frankliniella fusca TaxID=407009 RepID=A0AAE1GQF1_9NEOP|nr:Ubiquitin carboxyl-terminal hydrolase 36 [Frankliniella fusca]
MSPQFVSPENNSSVMLSQTNITPGIVVNSRRDPISPAIVISSDEEPIPENEGYHISNLLNIEDVANLTDETIVLVKFGISITAKQLKNLLSTEWLDDDKELARVIFIPIHLGLHWCLCVVEPKALDITYYDSMGGKNMTCLNVMCQDDVLKYLSFEWRNKNKTGPFFEGRWRLRCATGIGKQPNGFDCGIFVCYYARMVCEGRDITASIDWLPGMRRHILNEINACALDDLTTSNSSSVDIVIDLYPIPIIHEWDAESRALKSHGIINKYNICFAASTLQALFHCVPFVAWLKSDAHHRVDCDCLFCLLSKLYSDRLKQIADPDKFINSLKSFWPDYHKGTQQDSHEFLVKLLDNLALQFVSDLELNVRSLRTTPIHKIFEGELCTTVTCCECRRESATTAPFQILSVPIKPVLLEACKQFFAEELIQGYKFSVDEWGNTYKIKTFVKYQPVFVMTPFMKNAKVKYNLRSVVTHIGDSTNSGHYITVAQCPDLQFRNFNDQTVTLSSLRKALEEPAYMLFYERDPHF